MLTLILMVLLGLVILGGFILTLTVWSVGTVGALRKHSAIKREERATNSPEAMAERERLEARRSYLNSLVDRVESPEEGQAKEREERERYLRSLVDR